MDTNNIKIIVNTQVIYIIDYLFFMIKKFTQRTLS